MAFFINVEPETNFHLICQSYDLTDCYWTFIIAHHHHHHHHCLQAGCCHAAQTTASKLFSDVLLLLHTL